MGFANEGMLESDFFELLYARVRTDIIIISDIIYFNMILSIFCMILQLILILLLVFNIKSSI